jgi:arginine/lysine/ornithine decarboxylase
LWPGGVLTARALEQVARRALDHDLAPRRRRRRSSRSAAVWASALTPGEQALTPREAGRAPAVAVPLRAASGRVAAEPLVSYPPGLPVLVPGEVIGSSLVEVLQAILAAGGYVRGWDPGPATVRVVDI